MRGFRSTFILLVVLAGLLGYIYYYMRPGSPEPVEQKPKVFSAEADMIEELRIKGSSGEQSTLKRVDGVWRLVEPVQVPADETEVSGIVTNIVSLENQRTIDEKPADLAQYGLASPRVEIGFRKAGDKDLSRLLLGDKTATGGDMYVKLPSETRVFLVSSFLESTFDRTSFDLRDKSMLAFERDKVEQVEVAAQDQTVLVARVGDYWRLTRPIAARADTTAVDALIGRLQTGQMKSVAAPEPTPAELATFGLDKPEITVTVGAGSARAVLAVGKATADGTAHYARDAARPMVFTIERSLVEDLRKKTAEYRMKDTFEFRPYMATRVEATRGGVTVAFEKSRDKDGKETWAQVSPAKVVDSPKVESLLSALASMIVAGYVDAGTSTGADTPALVVTVKYDDGKKEERVTFGRAGGEVFAMRPGEPGAAKVEAAKFDEAIAALDALK